jgi:hypothetical protein
MVTSSWQRASFRPDAADPQVAKEAVSSAVQLPDSLSVEQLRKQAEDLRDLAGTITHLKPVMDEMALRERQLAGELRHARGLQPARVILDVHETGAHDQMLAAMPSQRTRDAIGPRLGGLQGRARFVIASAIRDCEPSG